MKYKGYVGTVEFDEDSGVLFGQVIGLRDVITFQGESVAEVIQAFHDSVDDYLEFCEVRGESPEKPYSGQFVVRLNSRLHRELANAALARKTSLNALVETTLTEVFVTKMDIPRKIVEKLPKLKPSREPRKDNKTFRDKGQVESPNRASSDTGRSEKSKGDPFSPSGRSGKRK
jgi:predicted HicB family RNase H-like nuclease